MTRGAIRFEGRDLAHLDERAMAKIRGDRIAMIFQEPMSSLNPLLSIGAHVAEPLRLHRGLSRREARTRAIALLDRVGIPSRASLRRLSASHVRRHAAACDDRGALACEPALLIADEPTTALDVTIQAQIMGLLVRPAGPVRHGHPVHYPRPGVVADRPIGSLSCMPAVWSSAPTPPGFSERGPSLFRGVAAMHPDEEGIPTIASRSSKAWCPQPSALHRDAASSHVANTRSTPAPVAEPPLLSLGPDHAERASACRSCGTTIFSYRARSDQALSRPRLSARRRPGWHGPRRRKHRPQRRVL